LTAYQLALIAVSLGVMVFCVVLVLLLYYRGKNSGTTEGISARPQRSLTSRRLFARKAPSVERSTDPIAFAPVTPQPPVEPTTFPRLNRRVGRYSVWAGIGFSGLTVVFLLLSASTQYIVYEVDSVVSFVAALILLLRDPRTRVQGKVLDAVLISSNKTMQELSGLEAESYVYMPKGNAVSEVVVVPRNKPSLASMGQRVEIIPPGRTLAEVFTREAGVAHPTLEEVRASLPYVLRESLGLAESASVDVREDMVDVTILGSSVSCGCKGKPGDQVSGSIGCTVASFMGVLVSASTKRPVLLGECIRDDSSGTWKIPMTLGQSPSGAS